MLLSFIFETVFFLWNSQVAQRTNTGILSQLGDHSQFNIPTEKLAFMAQFSKIQPFATPLHLACLT